MDLVAVDLVMIQKLLQEMETHLLLVLLKEIQVVQLLVIRVVQVVHLI